MLCSELQKQSAEASDGTIGSDAVISLPPTSGQPPARINLIVGFRRHLPCVVRIVDFL
eukprot:CAMPEP_0194034076 /NCGR_PEP_ID=MMETSP0009_2-20130614/6486_1 /TAXON_ID=210454 /ORGANISM="Grammatophora oceanica, Strain CCMP 410" /LENGTH=57 /DNA_ID=CAMNT_0038674821 /DNA_START=804 /DNA_END=974 /DNA_ORIENTATION=-